MPSNLSGFGGCFIVSCVCAKSFPLPQRRVVAPVSLLRSSMVVNPDLVKEWKRWRASMWFRGSCEPSSCKTDQVCSPSQRVNKSLRHPFRAASKGSRSRKDKKQSLARDRASEFGNTGARAKEYLIERSALRSLLFIAIFQLCSHVCSGVG